MALKLHVCSRVGLSGSEHSNQGVQDANTSGGQAEAHIGGLKQS